MTDDRDVQNPLLLTSPALLKRYLKSAVLRDLEIEAGNRYFDGTRLCFDLADAALAPPKFSRKEKGANKALI
eukprot:3681477-Pyramimonas_sp.AAC.1